MLGRSCVFSVGVGLVHTSLDNFFENSVFAPEMDESFSPSTMKHFLDPRNTICMVELVHNGQKWTVTEITLLL